MRGTPTNENPPPSTPLADVIARLRDRSVTQVEMDRRQARAKGSLGALRAGDRGRVTALASSVDGATARRLFDLGLAPGAVVEVVRRAPFGGPVIVRVADYEVAIRRGLAACVAVDPTAEGGTP